jgi:hypothetical protein
MTTKMEAKSKLRLNLVSPSTFATNLGEKKISNPVYRQYMFLISSVDLNLGFTPSIMG